jgi:hypothetical protein
MQIADAPAAGDGFIERRAARHFLDILAEVADGELAGHGNFAVVGSLLAHHHAEQRGFTGAVGAHQADFFARIQLERSVDENELLAVLLIDIGKRDQNTKLPDGPGFQYAL